MNIVRCDKKLCPRKKSHSNIFIIYGDTGIMTRKTEEWWLEQATFEWTLKNGLDLRDGSAGQKVLLIGTMNNISKDIL